MVSSSTYMFWNSIFDNQFSGLLVTGHFVDGAGHLCFSQDKL